MALVKLVWGIMVVLWLATSEPFWHQAVLVLGGAFVTASGTFASAWLMSRRVSRPIEHVKEELEAHRQAIEANGDDH